MRKCKITVLNLSVNESLGKEFCVNPVTKCPVLKEGQVFIADFEQPEGFCGWAWNDISKYVNVLLGGGNFSNGAFEGWMKKPDTMITCCTDGIRPVTFKLEAVDI